MDNGGSPLPEAKTVSFEDADFASGNFNYKHELELLAKSNAQAVEAETALSRQDLTTVKNEEGILNAYKCLQDNKTLLPEFQDEQG
ncbi:hypothetical protein A0J61_09796 [Choanephora cucurbitarum]|uniref:Uncharacterized protein n=1 Tax=Choanephora cucurbitarum TaxID=101091 RepID=A0A1C7MZA5_9FUNG|nr:hypothetical protein A0J61_09796 [Choanephora cucurbitarum]